MTRSVRWIQVVVALLALGATRAQAVVTGSIFGPGSNAFPIAVVPLKNLGGDADARLGNAFARALSRDLDFSGYFKLVDPKTFIEDPQNSGITADAIDFVGWGSLGAQALVKGGITVAGGGATVEVRLFDVPARKDVPAVSRRFNGSVSDVPRMAHKIADSILEFLTGERGPFDSQIALTRGKPLKDVYVWTFDRDEPVKVTDERSIVVGPRWRPDLRAIAFISYREHFQHLFQVDLGSKQVSRLVPGPNTVLSAAWSPDGSKLLITREEGGNTDIYLADRNGGNLQRLTDHWAIDVSPTWAPDGKRFAFCSARAGSPQIYVMGIDGSGLERVSRVGNYNTSPAWAPKGDHIAYATRTGGGFQIVVTSVDGSGSETITSGGSNEDPSWGPDGRYLVFSSGEGERHRLVLEDLHGKTRKELTRGSGDDTSPSWSPRSD